MSSSSSSRGVTTRPDFPAAAANFAGNANGDKDYVLDSCHVIAAPLNRHLRRYQRQGVKFLYRKCFSPSSSSSQATSGAILADDMGLGKTVQVIGLISALLKRTQVAADDFAACRRVRFGSEEDNDQRRAAAGMFLIVCPASVLRNWEQEFETWGYFVLAKYYKNDRDTALQLARLGRVEVVLTTFETARKDIDELNGADWDCVIVDEVHRIKDPKSKVTMALKSLRCRRRIGLTGTLLQNRYEELWCVLDWANPGCLGSIRSFRESYVEPIERGLVVDASKGKLAKARNLLKALEEEKARWVLRRTKDKTVADQLPTKVDQVVYCQPSSFQLSLFRAFHESDDLNLVLNAGRPCPCGSLEARKDCCDAGAPLREMRLRFINLFLKASNHVALLLPHHTASERQAEEGAKYCEVAFRNSELLDERKRGSFETLSNPKYSGKMKVLLELLEALKEEEEPAKVLLFSYSTALLDILEPFAQSLAYNYLRLDGKTRTEARQDLVEQFNSDPDVFLFLISTRAGGVGLNITGANVVIVFDPSWNPANDLQAQDRAYRIGQRRDVRVYRLITAGSIEENVYLRQVYKQQMSKNAVDGEKATRYFNAVLRHRQGELFGIDNMFAVRDPGKSCLTDGILKRKEAVEQVVRGKKTAYEIGDYLLECPNADANDDDGDEKEEAGRSGPSSSRPDAGDDCFGLELDEEVDECRQGGSSSEAAPLLSQWERKRKGVGDILKSKNIVHSHVNQDIVGGSRVEEHLSKVAVERVAAGRRAPDGSSEKAVGLEPVLLNCDMVEATQNMMGDDDGEEMLSSSDDEEERLAIDGEAVLARRRGHNDSAAVLRADSERMFRTSDGSPWLRYGQTPVALQRRDFDRLADYLGTTVEDAAESVLAMSPLERAELLQRFYISVGLSGAADAYEVIKGEIEGEERELREARERLREDAPGEEEEGATVKTTVIIAKKRAKKIPHQTRELPLVLASDCAHPPIAEQPVLSGTQDDNEGFDDEATSSASLSVLKPPPAESYSRKRSSLSSSQRAMGAGSFKSRGLTGEAYYDSILNPKSIKMEEGVQETQTVQETREGDEDGGSDDTEAVDHRAHRRMKVKPAPEEAYQSRSRKIPSEKQKYQKISLMDEYDKLLN